MGIIRCVKLNILQAGEELAMAQALADERAGDTEEVLDHNLNINTMVWCSGGGAGAGAGAGGRARGRHGGGAGP